MKKGSLVIQISGNEIKKKSKAIGVNGDSFY